LIPLMVAVKDPDRLVRDAAIRAVANNPSRNTDGLLEVAYANDIDDALRVAIANALGFRAKPASVGFLGRDNYGIGKSPAVASAVARALGKIAAPEAIEALKAMLPQTQGSLRLQVGDALAKCASKLIAAGKMDDARSIAHLLYQPEEPAKLAGLEALLRCSGGATAATILKVLAAGDRLETSVAVGYARELDSPAIKELADGLAALPAPAQVALVGALGARRDRCALPAVIVASTSKDQDVRGAALIALAGVGDRTSVPLLVKAIQEGGELATIARHSLETVFADGVDEALIENLKQAGDPGRRSLLIEILDVRRAAVAARALLDEVASGDAKIRRAAISALGNIAGPNDIPGMVRGLLKIKDAGERNEAAWAIASVCSRIADDAKRAEPVLAVYHEAPTAEQIALLPVLGRIGGAEAVALVREAIAGPDKDRRASGYDALFHSPDPAVAEDLAKLAETTPDKELRIHALHELARVVVLPGAGSDEVRLAFLVRGFNKSDRDAEKRLILDRAREIHSFEAVEFAAAQMNEPKLASQAIATVVDLLHRDEIRQPHQGEADKILDQVIKLSKDKSLVERAKSFKSGK
jgi:HEAT repeat protein